MPEPLLFSCLSSLGVCQGFFSQAFYRLKRNKLKTVPGVLHFIRFIFLLFLFFFAFALDLDVVCLILPFSCEYCAVSLVSVSVATRLALRMIRI